ncbi:MAG: TolC family protein, partial [Planctomycetales bacterium]|nr:TolC family protein [Planctomycetales bacterium]
MTCSVRMVLAGAAVAISLAGCCSDGARSRAVIGPRGSQPNALVDLPTGLASLDQDDHSHFEKSAIRLASDASDTPASESTTAPLPVNEAMRLTIRQAIETSLTQNPDLVALRQTEGVSAAALGVAATYPFNPWVQVQATPYQDARVGSPTTTAHYVLVMQQIQLAHQQQHREEAAGAALNGVRWNLLQAELLNIAQTQRLYFAAVYQQGLRDLARVIADNNAQLLTILERQLAAGAATAADVAMVRMDARSTQRQMQLAEANLQTALLDLRRHLGLSPDAEIALDDEAFRWEWAVTTKEHLTALSATRPDVLAAHADIDAARANTNLACAARTPDLQIGPF